MTEMSRRTFVGATAGTAALLAIGAQLAHADETDEAIEADVVVVGAGVAGLSAARAAAEAGARVVVVEKAEGFSSRGGFGCQFGAVNSSYQIEQGIVIDTDMVKDRFMRDTLQMSKQFFLNYWIDNSGATLDWALAAYDNVQYLPMGSTRRDAAELEDGVLGVFATQTEATTKTSPDDRYPKFNTTVQIQDNSTELFEGGFNKMLAGFERIVLESGGEFLYSTFCRSIVTDDSGAVTGVLAERQDGSTVAVRAAMGVVLATGDFSNNREMLEKYAPQALDLMPFYNSVDCNGSPCNTGDGHLMALEAGAHMECGPYAPMSHLRECDKILLVNRKGERFINEDLGAQSITNAIMHLPGRTVWAITSEEMGPFSLNPGPTSVVPDTALSDFAELAAYIDPEHCDPAVLQATVERYNELCAQGHDDDFGKDARYMVALDGPLFATASGPGNMLVITGGIDCDDNCQALNANDDPIPGLFVCGNVMGGRFGAEYPMTCPGISHGSCFTLGRLAGMKVVELA